MNRIKYKKNRGTDYPPDNGSCYWHWNYNFVCVPCKKVRRGRYRVICLNCKNEMMKVKKLSPPKKNDSWWKRASTMQQWIIHMRIVSNRGKE